MKKVNLDFLTTESLLAMAWAISLPKSEQKRLARKIADRLDPPETYYESEVIDRAIAADKADGIKPGPRKAYLYPLREP